ncbi:MAG TPA: hypothetical protein VNE82_14200 [Candidatus Binataceae bacterium]|nr:hypothetical protein [Candidatus Binataceae bacterium]
MKGTIATLFGTLTVGAALALPAASFAQAPGQLHRQRTEHFPVMHGAIQQLEQTKAALANDAAADFHSHKANAIKDINSAIQELRAGIQEERKH